MKAINAVLPIRRDLQFKPPADRIHDWADGNVQVTHLMNTMSLVIPVGERFFIDAVRHYRDQITDPDLKKAATAFIGQEAMHGREHDDYNSLMFDRVPSSKPFEDRILKLLNGVAKVTPKSTQLAVTIALEHLTAIMADGLLNEPHLREKSEKHFAALWEWHALEETEHKAVAYDVYQTIIGGGVRGYAERTFALTLATAVFWAMVIPAFLGFVRHEEKLGDGAGWREFWRVNFGELGFLRKMVRPWFSWFRPGFHPWDDDNSHFLEGIDEMAAPWVKVKPAKKAA